MYKLVELKEQSGNTENVHPLLSFRSSFTNKTVLAIQLYKTYRNNRREFARIRQIEKQIDQINKDQGRTPENSIIFLNVSSGLLSFALNNLFGLTASWGCRISSQNVVHLLCHKGMSRCLHGTYWRYPKNSPPCKECINFRSSFFQGGQIWKLKWNIKNEQEQINKFNHYTMEELKNYHYDNLPLGNIILPSVMWALRKENIDNDLFAKEVFIDYLISCINMIPQMNRILEEVKPIAVVLFNGTFYPEALMRHLAINNGIRTVTYEGGYLPLTSFFTHKIATEYNIDYATNYHLSHEEEKQLNMYLEQRFNGNFTMAGVIFWKDMIKPTPEILEKISKHEHLVTIFTNVTFDTSQVYANKLFTNMFEWLDFLLKLIKENQNTLFIIRAHPAELRPGKESRHTIFNWLQEREGLELSNLVFISPTEYIDSYDLIKKSNFCAIYNSTIGLEAAILEKPVLCGGHTRYKNANIGIYPETKEEYKLVFKNLLEKSEWYDIEKQKKEAKKYLYYSMFIASLDFSYYLLPGPNGTASIRNFDIEKLKPENSHTMERLCRGIIDEKPFISSENPTILMTTDHNKI